MNIGYTTLVISASTIVDLLGSNWICMKSEHDYSNCDMSGYEPSLNPSSFLPGVLLSAVDFTYRYMQRERETYFIHAVPVRMFRPVFQISFVAVQSCCWLINLVPDVISE